MDSFDSEDDDFVRMLKLGASVALSLVLLLAWRPLRVVQAGQVAVINSLGAVSERPLPAGPHAVFNPFARLETFSIKTRLLDSENVVPTSEGLNVELDVSLLYHVRPEGVRELFLTAGPEYEQVLVTPTLRSAVRNLTSESSAKALYTSGRELLRDRLLEELQHKLEKRGIEVEDVLLRNIVLPDQLTKAIEAKLASEQESQKMEFVLAKEAQEAERKAIEARGVAEFQEIVSKGITPEMLKWKGIEATEKLAESDNAKVVVVGGSDGLPLILGGDK